MQEAFEKIDAILQKYRKKWLEQPNTEPCKGLECISNDCVDCMLTHLENDINQVAEKYNQGSNENNQGWIPVSEGLPKDSGDVLITTRSSVCGVGSFLKNYGWVQWYSGGSIVVEAIAWQPLPKPYKPEDEEKRINQF